MRCIWVENDHSFKSDSNTKYTETYLDELFCSGSLYVPIKPLKSNIDFELIKKCKSETVRSSYAEKLLKNYSHN